MTTKKNVLIIDDDPRVCRLIENMGGDDEYQYTEMHDARSLKDLYKELVPDKIFLDLSMPRMDGIEALNFLKEENSSSHICLISGWSEKLLRSSCSLGEKFGLNMSPPIQKPFSTAEIISFLRDGSGKRGNDRAKPILQTSDRMESELRMAIKGDGELHPFYQPIINLQSGKIHSLEALCRWHHPTRGIITPDIFLPLVEKMGLTKEMTCNLLVLILDDMLCWQSIDAQLNISINVFPKLLELKPLPDILTSFVKKAGIDPSRITLEITEQDDYGCSVEMLNVIFRLRLAGFGISIDDFGTGFATMDKLRNIPFTELKIDKSFVSELLYDRDAKAIVSSSITLAHEIGIPAVAEGIEDQQTLDWLRHAGCDMGQGYFFSRPRDFDQTTSITQSSGNTPGGATSWS